MWYAQQLKELGYLSLLLTSLILSILSLEAADLESPTNSCYLSTAHAVYKN